MALDFSGFRAAVLRIGSVAFKRQAIERGLRIQSELSIRPDGEMKAIASEAVAPQLFTLTSGDGEDAGFRRISSLPTLRDLNPMMHDRMQQVCYFLRVTTPFGKRIVEIITSYSVGKGVRVTATDAKVQDVIDKFWEDEVNDVDAQLPVWCDELTTFGEICLPFARNPVDGFVRLGYVDPMNIDGIRFAQIQTAQGTATINFPFGVQLRREVGEVSQKVLPIVRRCEDPNNPLYGMLDGECFYHTINKAKSASRGFSELFSLADWIDVFDQSMFDFADKVRLQNAFVWHYILDGADAKATQAYMTELTKNPPRQGGVHVTNEKVKIEAQTPEFHGADMAAGMSMLKKYGMGGAGLPGTFFADGDDANKASSLEMNAPAVKKFQDRQNNMERLLSRILNYVLDSAVAAGVLPQNVDRSFSIEFPEIAVKDLQRGAQTLAGVGMALVSGTTEGWITNATAARAFHTILAEIGCDVEDSAQEYQDAQQEMQDRRQEQADGFSQQVELAKALAAGKQQSEPEPKLHQMPSLDTPIGTSAETA